MMQFSRGHNDLFAHAAVHHHAEHFQSFAAIAVAAAASEALLAIHVRLDRTEVALIYIGHARAVRNDCDAQLVSRNSRITEEWHLAEIAGVIRAADPDAMNAHERLACPRWFRRRDARDGKLSRLLE